MLRSGSTKVVAGRLPFAITQSCPAHIRGRGGGQLRVPGSGLRTERRLGLSDRMLTRDLSLSLTKGGMRLLSLLPLGYTGKSSSKVSSLCFQDGDAADAGRPSRGSHCPGTLAVRPLGTLLAAGRQAQLTSISTGWGEGNRYGAGRRSPAAVHSPHSSICSGLSP